MGLRDKVKRLSYKIKPKGHFKLTFKNIETGAERVSEYDNAITGLCLEMLAKRLGSAGNDCNVTYIAVGTGIFPADPTASTTLVSELARKALTTKTYSGRQALLTGFFGASEGNGTLTEIATFGEAASATPDSGTIINHAAITETKTSAETMTVEITITFA